MSIKLIKIKRYFSFIHLTQNIRSFPTSYCYWLGWVDNGLL